MATKHYEVGWDYRSSLGVLTKGTTVELDDEYAALVNRDSPGVLEEADADQQSKIEAAKKALAEATGQGDPETAEVDLDGLKKKELVALAAELGVQISKKENMDTIRAAIRAAQTEADSDSGDGGEESASDPETAEVDADTDDGE